jgi:hypothetical protein
MRRTTIITTLMMACSFGVAFGAIQQVTNIMGAVPDVRARAVEAGKGKTEVEAKRASGTSMQKAAAEVSQNQEWGGLTGRLMLAILVTIIISQRKLIRLFLVPGLIVLPIVFLYLVYQGQTALSVGMFLLGLFTVGQFSFWGNYLPRVYPLHLRGTGESFAANIGGRMIGTSFALFATELALLMPGATDAVRMAAAAAVVGTFAYVANVILSFWLPEPQHAELPEQVGKA